MNSIERRIRRLENELELQKEKQRKILEKECTTVEERIMKEAYKRGITQGELAKMCGVSRQQISNYFNGRCKINVEALAKVAKAFNVTCDYLIFG